ncbi:MAG TPA: sugar phosphate isomerase/epimerase family protein [Bryobacteraceae bacterium]|nr:sugar phosphate isomerase/epimerase family protein [Bryobacteraceae bacterium]
MTRRELLAGSAGILAASRLQAFKSRITKAKISAITDEIGKTQADAIAFAHEYGLQCVELRNVPETKKEFAFLTEPELKRWASELEANKLKVTFLNTSLLKFTWPGTTPERMRKETDEQHAARMAADQKRWERRKEDVESAVRAANILGVDKVRVFTGTRVANPETTFPLIVRTMEELIPIAEKGKVHLLIENESTQNIGTSVESKAIMELLPSKTIGLNWDPQNALPLKEVPWPNGYAEVPKNRLMNAQIKAKGVIAESPEKIDWKSIMEAMQKDNYQGHIGLETHIFDGRLIEKAHESMRDILHMVGELS